MIIVPNLRSQTFRYYSARAAVQGYVQSPLTYTSQTQTPIIYTTTTQASTHLQQRFHEELSLLLNKATKEPRATAKPLKKVIALGGNICEMHCTVLPESDDICD
jgi:hypothetical protein